MRSSSWVSGSFLILTLKVLRKTSVLGKPKPYFQAKILKLQCVPKPTHVVIKTVHFWGEQFWSKCVSETRKYQ